MVDRDEQYMKEFFARAEMRQKKLLEQEKFEHDRSKKVQAEVTYPPLSPLLEESPQSSRCTRDISRMSDVEDVSYRDDDEEDDASVSTQENVINKLTELNYSSDLSLDLEPEDLVYRAEPVVCNSSPERPTLATPKFASPRKSHAPSAPTSSQCSIPLQERQIEQKYQSQESRDQYLTELSNLIDQANQTRSQLKKVVELSKYGSKEHIEAARRLQFTEAKHFAYSNQMAAFKQGIRRKTECLGTIKISDIKIKMTSKLRNDLAMDEFSHFFYCVGSAASQVKETEMVTTSQIAKQSLKTYIEFEKSLEFIDLPSDFVIKIEFFELVTGQALPKFLSRLTPSKRTKITPESCFKRIGSIKLTLVDNDCNYRNLTKFSTQEESKYIEKECKFIMEIFPEKLPYKFGMLDARFLENGVPFWKRYFVELSEGQIKFWNSRQDAKDGKKPNEIINIIDICSDKIQKLTPNDDLYRKNSFLLYSYQKVAGGERDNLLQRLHNTDSKIVKHQLGADSREERESWCVILDKYLFTFREWHGRQVLFTPEQLNDAFIIG